MSSAVVPNTRPAHSTRGILANTGASVSARPSLGPVMANIVCGDPGMVRNTWCWARGHELGLDVGLITAIVLAWLPREMKLVAVYNSSCTSSSSAGGFCKQGTRSRSESRLPPQQSKYSLLLCLLHSHIIYSIETALILSPPHLWRQLSSEGLHWIGQLVRCRDEC